MTFLVEQKTAKCIKCGKRRNVEVCDIDTIKNGKIRFICLYCKRSKKKKNKT